MKKKALWTAVLATFCLLTVVSALAIAAYADSPFVLTPRGRIRVALRSYGAGTATWFATEPLVYDGSFSARLHTAGADSDAGGIMIGPLSWPLSMFADNRITFWAYHISDAGGYDQTHQPYIDIVLDNGRVMEGVTSTPVSPTAVVNSLTNQGYPSADLWVQMKPSGGWYTGFATAPTEMGGSTPDPVLAPVAACTLTSTCTMATWQHAFPTARVIQIEIIYGLWSTGGALSICIDNVSILSYVVPIEPEVISA
jgi:hypothetical protein